MVDKWYRIVDGGWYMNTAAATFLALSWNVFAGF